MNCGLSDETLREWADLLSMSRRTQENQLSNALEELLYLRGQIRIYETKFYRYLDGEG